MSDKIYEAYIGNWGKEFQMKVKKRFAWIAEMVEGNSILDIGCSQGIFDILLARENKNVIGIDLSKEAIDKANELKMQEPENIQNSLKFLNMSFNDYSTNDKYDTIILGEILEHLFYPENLISKSYNLLNEKGVLVITLPFGINDYFDHKKDYYLFDIINKINYEFKLLEVGYFENWIGIKAMKKEIKSHDDFINIEILNKFEKQINNFEHNNYLKVVNLTKEIQNFEKQINDMKEQINEMNIDENVKNDKLSQINTEITKLQEEKEYYKKLTYKYKNDLAKVNNRLVLRMIRKIKGISKLRIFKKATSAEKFYKNIPNYIEKISDSNGSNYYKKSDIKIGIITDEYMYNYYKDAVNLYYIPPKDYKNIVDNVDFVLFVSCWKGMKNDEWLGMTAGKIQEKVIEVFEYAKSKNIKTVFQTIEDPSNFDIFLPIAKHSDYIFTSAMEMIEEYKKETGNNKVYVLDYGVNPQFHNPISFKSDKNKSKNGVFFAGSWTTRYKERCQDTEVMFDGVVASRKRFVIADRNHNLNLKGYDFPSKYGKYIVPSIKHEQLQKVHKLFDWSLNLNSIKYSPTMCAMRVYELQAIGNLLISNYSMAVNNNFPNIFIVKDSNEVSNILNKYTDLDKFRMQVNGIRNVMSTHTTYDKLNYIFNIIGENKYSFNNKKVLVLVKKMTSQILNTFNDQTYQYKDIKEISEINQDFVNKYDYVTILSPQIKYKENYLQDMINGFKYTNSSFITINSEVIKGKIVGQTYEYVKKANNKYKTIFDTKFFKLYDIINSENIVGDGFCIDPFEITEFHRNTKKPEISVIVPVYNNGKYLMGKCFNSLLRSAFFDRMEVILIDDGSSDIETKRIVMNLEKEYDNVKTYFFDGKPSGSASRPRNKGVELATTKYLAFLDPDDELINNGYEKLYNKIKEDNYDMVFASAYKLGIKEGEIQYFKKDIEINNPKKILIEFDFQPHRLQACLIKKDFITKNKIESVVGAFGEDTVFFEELMLNAKKVYYINTPIHIYYAAREGSAVNSIDHNFFKKSFLAEKYQVEKLKEYGVLEEYITRRLEHFINNWYLKKLELVEDLKEKELSEKIIEDIVNLYK